MKKTAIFILLLSLLTGCARFGKKETDGGKDTRIACVSKHLTEMMVALGKGRDIVACDLTSSHSRRGWEFCLLCLILVTPKLTAC